MGILLVNRMLQLCFILAATLSVIGCGGSDQPANVMDGAGEEAMQSYEEMVAADEAMMSESDAADEVTEEPAATE